MSLSSTVASCVVLVAFIVGVFQIGKCVVSELLAVLGGVNEFLAALGGVNDRLAVLGGVNDLLAADPSATRPNEARRTKIRTKAAKSSFQTLRRKGGEGWDGEEEED